MTTNSMVFQNYALFPHMSVAENVAFPLSVRQVSKADIAGRVGRALDMRKFPAQNLEWALMADGVAPADVYKVLATPEGVDRAFKKLDTIKNDIVWWDAGAQPAQLLASKEVVMTTAWNGRIQNAIDTDKKPFKIVWNNQILEYDMAGCLLTFILCLGYYITPALIGGASDQLISNFIANYVNVELNWEMAAALSFILLVFTLALFGIFARILGLDRLKMV